MADAIPTEALADIAYLSRSDNRVAILDALAREPRPRRELGEATGVSRTTLDRIVNELEDRGWAERTPDGEYATTPAGAHLIAELRPFLDSVEAIRRLDDALAWLPDDLDVGLRHFSDATVRRPEGADPMETIDYFVDLATDASELLVLSHLAPPAPLARTMRDRIAAGALTITGVVTGDCVDYMAEHPERRARWRAIVESGGELYRYDDHLPCNLFVIGEVVLIKQSAPEPVQESYGVPIESRDGTVREWAVDLIERYRTGATRVDADTFAEPIDGGDDAR
jgi:predicted transcriptional regulator